MRITFVIAYTFAALSVSAAQLYKWTDEKGNVEWRDTPPPSTAKKVEQRNMGGNTIETSTLPYSLQQAVKNHPVTLWVFECGTVCNDARAHLAKRGIPHTERTPEREAEAMKKMTGGLDAPVLVVGSQQLKGYTRSAWDAALDAAGYPQTAIAGIKTPVKKDAPKDSKATSKEADAKAAAKDEAKAPIPAFPR